MVPGGAVTPSCGPGGRFPSDYRRAIVRMWSGLMVVRELGRSAGTSQSRAALARMGFLKRATPQVECGGALGRWSSKRR